MPQTPDFSSGDFMEALIMHLVRCPKTFNQAKKFGLTKSDFSLQTGFENLIYELFVDICLTVDSCPISPQLFLAQLKARKERNEYFEIHEEPIVQLLGFIYSGTLDPDYYSRHVKSFAKLRREERSKVTATSNDELRDQLNEIAINLTSAEVAQSTESGSPFERPVFTDPVSLLGTGLPLVDTDLGGLKGGEFGIILGFSGGGKTCLGVNICTNNAVLGHKSTFMSLEESFSGICNRAYSRFFRIAYRQLRTGEANMQLQDRFNNPEESDAVHLALLRDNFHIEGLKDVAPLSADDLYQTVVRKYEATGFIPEVIVVDQLQFLHPKNNLPGTKSWEKDALVSIEFDEMANRLVGGRPIVWWLLHQLKGKLKEFVTTDEIDGWKGLQYKPETILSLGRKTTEAVELVVSSLKNRHGKNFHATVFGELEYMNILPHDPRALAISNATAPTPSQNEMVLAPSEVPISNEFNRVIPPLAQV